ncbi:MAG TPA: hypothetical protein VGK67_26810 [Myxococcales bacterium]
MTARALSIDHVAVHVAVKVHDNVNVNDLPRHGRLDRPRRLPSRAVVDVSVDVVVVVDVNGDGNVVGRSAWEVG